jgi:HAD superfamily hydrolase (TIGR01509 family)
MLKAVFVDLDGTLADTLSPLYTLFCDLLRPYGVKGTKREFRELMGPSLREIVAILKSRYPIQEASFLQEYYKGVKKLYANSELFPHALETLNSMKRKGLALFLVTSATKKLAALFLERHGLLKLFEGVVTADELAGKPSPAIFKKALKVAKVEPAEAIAIEDSPQGVEAALSAGIYTFRLYPRLRYVRFHAGYVDVADWEALGEVYGLSDV